MKLENDLQLQITDVSAVRETGKQVYNLTMSVGVSSFSLDQCSASRFDESDTSNNGRAGKSSLSKMYVRTYVSKSM
jgi:hypothetical protein